MQRVEELARDAAAVQAAQPTPIFSPAGAAASAPDKFPQLLAAAIQRSDLRDWVAQRA